MFLGDGTCAGSRVRKEQLDTQVRARAILIEYLSMIQIKNNFFWFCLMDHIVKP